MSVSSSKPGTTSHADGSNWSDTFESALIGAEVTAVAAGPIVRVDGVSTPRLGAVSLDCADPGALATFWAELLDGEIVRITDAIGIVRLEDLLLTAMRVDDYAPPTWPSGPQPKQGHVDLAVDDLHESAARAISLGAVRAGWQPDPDSHVVMLDPAGHPFCLSLLSNFP